MKLRLTLLALAATFSAVLLGATVRLRHEAAALRAEQQHLLSATRTLQPEIATIAAALTAITTAERDQAAAVATLESQLSPAARHVVRRGLETLVTPSAPSATAARTAPAPLPPLLQSKIDKIYFDQLLDRPDYARAAAIVERLDQERLYAAFLASLALTPEQRTRFTDLLVDRELGKRDIGGLNLGVPLPTVMEQRRAAERTWRIRATEVLGEANLNRFFAHDGSLLLRTAVEQLEIRTAHTATPLLPAQAAATLDTLVAALGPRVGSRYWTIPAAALDQLRSILTPAQFSVLTQIHEERLSREAARADKARS